jgi:LPXTG-motif cell wall-anchored protein
MKSYIAAALLMLVSSQALAQALPTSVPAIDDVGLVGLIALVGLVGGLIARRKKR